MLLGGDWYEGDTGSSLLSAGAGGCKVFSGAKECGLDMCMLLGVDTGGL